MDVQTDLNWIRYICCVYYVIIVDVKSVYLQQIRRLKIHKLDIEDALGHLVMKGRISRLSSRPAGVDPRKTASEFFAQQTRNSWTKVSELEVESITKARLDASHFAFYGRLDTEVIRLFLLHVTKA